MNSHDLGLTFLLRMVVGCSLLAVFLEMPVNSSHLLFLKPFCKILVECYSRAPPCDQTNIKDIKWKSRTTDPVFVMAKRLSIHFFEIMDYRLSDQPEICKDNSRSSIDKRSTDKIKHDMI